MRGALGESSQTPLQRILALSPSLLIWPAQATMTVATDGTGAAPTSGQSVGRILDLSGSGNHLIAGTWASPADSSRALLSAGGALNFDGVNDYYSLLNAINITENMTVVRAFKRASAVGNRMGLGKSDAFVYPDVWDSGGAVYLRFPGGSNITGQAATGSFVHATRRNSTNATIRRNGVQILDNTPGAAANLFDVVGRISTTYNSDEISFLAVFDRELTGADLALVEQIAAATNGAALA